MNGNQISPFEYVSILVSIILGLGITQILSAFSDLLYNFKKVKLYWPHTLWIVFILFLHIQDWFITYQLRGKTVWNLPELSFVLLYPITLFMIAKMMLPTNEAEEKQDMKSFYFAQFPIMFYITALGILSSLLFNYFFLEVSIWKQTPLLLFLATILYLPLRKINAEVPHKILAMAITLGALLSVILEKDVWVVN